MITDHLPPIYLASGSPRRQELLKQVGIEFAVVSHNVAEERLANESAEKMVERLAIAKALDAAERNHHLRPRPVLGADTVVMIGDQILGKPHDEEDALRMLSLLSGKTHQVLSAVAVVNRKQVNFKLNKNLVTFAEISPEEALRYWRSGEPADKAGAYGIQGKAGIFIKHIEGSYSGIMGLPLYETYALLEECVNTPVYFNF